MASLNTRFRSKCQGADLWPLTDEVYMAERFGWTEPPYFDEDPEEAEYRIAALPEHERVAHWIGPEYSEWNDDLFHYWYSWDMHNESLRYQLENYEPQH